MQVSVLAGRLTRALLGQNRSNSNHAPTHFLGKPFEVISAILKGGAAP